MRKREVDRYRDVLESQLAALVGNGEQAVHEMAGAGGEEIPDPNDRATVEEGRNWSLRLARPRPEAHRQDRRTRSPGSRRARSASAPRAARAIAPARLRARPVTDLCIDCKTEAERAER